MATKKRGQNEGSIFQRENGTWVGKMSLGYDVATHRRVRKEFTGKTKDEVRRKLTEAMRGNDLGLNVNPKAQTVAQFLGHWLEEVVKQRVRESTYRSYEQIVRNHLVPGLGKLPLQRLTPQALQAFLNAKAETGISVEHLRRVLRSALSHAVKWDLVPRNAAALVSTPKKERHEFVHLSPEQARAFLAAAGEHRLEALFTVAVAVGLRLGEALGLRWQDVDLDAGTLTVRYQLQRLKDGPRLVEPKTARSRRTVPLPAFAVAALRAHRFSQLEERLLNADVWKDQGLVFPSSVGTFMFDRNVRRTLDAILKKCELPPMRFHDLRHTCATLLLAQGTDARTIMETLGHSTITLTLNTYSHVVPALQRDAADRMNRLLGESA